METSTTNRYLFKQCPHPFSTKAGNSNRTLRVKQRKEYITPKNEVEKKTMSFEVLLLEAIDEGLSLLGESAKQVVYFHLEKNFKINRQDIPYKIKEFTDAIEKIFGNGAKILEIHIIKCLFKKVGSTFKHHPKQTNLEFTEYIAAVKLAKNNYEDSKEQQMTTNRKQNGKKDNMRAKTLWRLPNPSNWIFKNFSWIVLF